MPSHATRGCRCWPKQATLAEAALAECTGTVAVADEDAPPLPGKTGSKWSMMTVEATASLARSSEVARDSAAPIGSVLRMMRASCTCGAASTIWLAKDGCRERRLSRKTELMLAVDSVLEEKRPMIVIPFVTT